MNFAYTTHCSFSDNTFVSNRNDVINYSTERIEMAQSNEFYSTAMNDLLVRAVL